MNLTLAEEPSLFKPGVGTGEVYPFSDKQTIKKSHATEPFEKEDRLGAAEPCLFGDNIVTNEERFCQVVLIQKVPK